MSIYTKRVKTLRTLLEGSILKAHPIYPKLYRELNQVENVLNINPRSRRLLLQVLHSTRLFDSFLRTYIVQRGIPGNPFSIGAALRILRNHSKAGVGQISHSEYWRYYNSVAKLRNRYMHEADAYPSTDNDVIALINQIHACLARVITL